MKILSTGSYLPENVVSNDALTHFLETSDEWIKQRTGIAARHISMGEQTSDLGYRSALLALDRANVLPEQIDFIIVATMSGDYGSPSTACIIQEKLGAINAFAFDLNAACSGFVYALATAEKFLQSGGYQYGLVIGAEVMSKLVDWSDRSTAVLFGDGAGCVLVQRNDTLSPMISQLHSDGRKCLSLTSQPNGLQTPFAQTVQESAALHMNGRDIFNFATKKVPELIETTLAIAHQTFDDVDYVLCHQANLRMLELIAKQLQQPFSKFPTNVERVGNTSAGSLPILLDELVTSNHLLLNGSQRIMLVGFGGGLTWGSLLLQI